MLTAAMSCAKAVYRDRETPNETGLLYDALGPSVPTKRGDAAFLWCGGLAKPERIHFGDAVLCVSGK